jgi:hypothetical protein
MADFVVLAGQDFHGFKGLAPPPWDEDPLTARQPRMFTVRATISPSLLWEIIMAMSFRFEKKVIPGKNRWCHEA